MNEASQFRYMSRIIFKSQLENALGYNYQTICEKVLKKIYPDFIEIRPLGKLGDGGNDGYIPTIGHYFQCYAPSGYIEHIDYSKIEKDFQKLLDNWTEIVPIKKYTFIIRDLPIPGSNIVLEEKLSKLRLKFPEINFSLLKSSELEEKFDSLSESNKETVIGLVPVNLPKIIDIDCLADVVEYVIHNTKPINVIFGKLPQNPKFEEKLTFNELSQAPCELLRNANYKITVIDQYFANPNKVENKILLQKQFNQFYKEGLAIYNESIDRNDMVFAYILNSCLGPNAKDAHQGAALVLMSYYFEWCDIFEEPPKID